jgi:hypothetical protein
MSSQPGEFSITTLLCDSAQVSDGKLYILGGGWSICGPGPFIHALALKIEVPWTAANQPHTLGAVLLNEDGSPVRLDGEGDEVRFENRFEIGRPPGLRPGTPLDLPLAVNLGPLQLPSGKAYSWALSIDGTEAGRTFFQTRPDVQ